MTGGTPTTCWTNWGRTKLAAVVHLLETMIAPDEDGDTLNPSERLAIGEADAWLQHNRYRKKSRGAMAKRIVWDRPG